MTESKIWPDSPGIYWGGPSMVGSDVKYATFPYLICLTGVAPFLTISAVINHRTGQTDRQKDYRQHRYYFGEKVEFQPPDKIPYSELVRATA